MELFKRIFFLTIIASLANGLFYQRRLQEQKALQEIYGRRRYDDTHLEYVRPIDTGYALAGYGFTHSVFGLILRHDKKAQELQRRKRLLEKYRNFRNEVSDDSSGDGDSQTDDGKTES